MCALDNFAILRILWLLGLVSSYSVGGFVPLLLVVAGGVLLIRVIEDRRPLVCRPGATRFRIVRSNIARRHRD